MAEGKDDMGKLWMGWRAHPDVWFVYGMEGAAKASIGMKGVQWGLDTLKHLNGDVSCPPLNPNLGSNGTPKFMCINACYYDEVMALRKKTSLQVRRLGGSAKKSCKEAST